MEHSSEELRILAAKRNYQLGPVEWTDTKPAIAADVRFLDSVDEESSGPATLRTRFWAARFIEVDAHDIFLSAPEEELRAMLLSEHGEIRGSLPPSSVTLASLLAPTSAPGGDSQACVPLFQIRYQAVLCDAEDLQDNVLQVRRDGGGGASVGDYLFMRATSGGTWALHGQFSEGPVISSAGPPCATATAHPFGPPILRVPHSGQTITPWAEVPFEMLLQVPVTASQQPCGVTPTSESSESSWEELDVVAEVERDEPQPAAATARTFTADPTRLGVITVSLTCKREPAESDGAALQVARVTCMLDSLYRGEPLWPVLSPPKSPAPAPAPALVDSPSPVLYGATATGVTVNCGLRCPKSHNLTRHVASLSDDILLPQLHICDVCDVLLPLGSDRYYCRECNYDVCARCYRNAPSCNNRALTRRQLYILVQCSCCHALVNVIFDCGCSAPKMHASVALCQTCFRICLPAS